jgi:hypothetical protein
MMAVSVLHHPNDLTSPQATMCRCHATAVAMGVIRRSLGVSPYDAKRSTTG